MSIPTTPAEKYEAVLEVYRNIKRHAPSAEFAFGGHLDLIEPILEECKRRGIEFPVKLETMKNVRVEDGPFIIEQTTIP